MPCANRRGPSDHPATLPNEVIEAPEVQEAPDVPDHLGTTGPDTEDIAPTSHTAGSCATTTQAVASPAVPPKTPFRVCPPISLTNLIANVPTSSTPRTALR